MITWNGHNSDEFGVIVEHYPGVIIPKRKIEVQSVAGRSDDIIIPSEGFENYEQQYSIFLDVKNIGGLEVAIPKISDWLFSEPGYHRLEDSYFPEYYRMAYLANGQQFSTLLNEYGEGTVSFNCAPERYLKTGEHPITINSNAVLLNPTGFKAKPLMTFTAPSVDSTITFINGETGSANGTVTIKAIKGAPTVTLDVQAHKIFTNASYVGVFDTSLSYGIGEYVRYTKPVNEGETATERLYMFIADHAAGAWNDAHAQTVNVTNDILSQGYRMSGKFEDLQLMRNTKIIFSEGITNITLVPRWWTI